MEAPVQDLQWHQHEQLEQWIVIRLVYNNFDIKIFVRYNIDIEIKIRILKRQQKISRQYVNNAPC